MRNSSLVERDCAEDGTGLKLVTEVRDLSYRQVVGERCHCGEGRPARSVGAVGSENAGMSSEHNVRTIVAEGLRFPTEGQSTSGESGLSKSREAYAMDNR